VPFPDLSGLVFPSSTLEFLLLGMAGIMDQRNHGVYPPLNVLKPAAQNLWTTACERMTPSSRTFS
jgi:hypothetical protein